MTFWLIVFERNQYVRNNLSGKTPDLSFEPLLKPDNNVQHKRKVWCMVGRGANASELVSALLYACLEWNKTCDLIQPEKECFEPDSLVWHASYVFSSYWS
ncbi:hypothetical protein Godav_027208 [Gossypium davidsonii]|uniref:X8 domain-containing protein n=1 Tax=Gossypium davidsonii TaxID=34287 RepID=A0A7J8RVB3_GOSDV|nr:hypothetical protein [Gossypium davidsonii]